MNILLTSAGRRGYLVEFFKKELNGSGQVHVGNSSALSPAFYYGDKCIVTPLIYDADYIPFLLRYCRENQIDALIPLFDVDLSILAQHKAEFEQIGVSAIVSDPSVISACNDKWNTYQFCMEHGFLAPKTYCRIADVKAALLMGELSYPVIVKPRWGMGSIAVYQAENEEELDVFAKKVQREIFASYLRYESAFDKDACVVFQQKIEGQEYGLDVVHDLCGTHKLTVVRKKIAMRSGETDCAQIVEDAEIEKLGTAVGKALGHIGNLDMDFFAAEDGVYVLEMNARFGGGYPFSHLAGVNLPRAMIKWLKGEEPTEELTIQKTGILAQKDIRMLDITECVKAVK